MAIADWFMVKSKKQREREFRHYTQWAYPYGDEQKELVTKIMKELIPEEPGETAIAVYLIGKEGYQGAFDDDPEDLEGRTEEQKLGQAMGKMQAMLPGRCRKFIYRYMAMILADAQVDESLNYPTVEQLRQNAAELENALKIGK